MTKKLDETTIMNELRGSSAFFPHTASEKVDEQPTQRPSERTEFRTENRSEKRPEKRSEYRTDQLPIKRRSKRYSFEFYDDQIMKLKLLKRQAEDHGENLTLSDIAREAFDQYLKRTEKRSE